MSKRLTAAAVLVAINLSIPGSASAQAASSQATTSTTSAPIPTKLQLHGNQGEDGTVYQLEISTSSASAPRTPAPRGSVSVSSATTPPVYPAYFPALVPGPDGSYCIQPQRRLYSDPATAALYDNAQEARWLMLTRNYQLCGGVERPPGNPVVEAADYWRQIGEDLLPKPQPQIAPGYMLAGKLGYLEANSPSTARFEHDTALGRLIINAENDVWVDWDDGGGLTGPHDGPGAPWPSGTITHFWTDARTYDVRVVQRWTATWELAGRRGQLAGLATEGLIDDFEVRQLQAVRNR